MHEPMVALVQAAGIITTVGVGALIRKRVSTRGASGPPRAGQEAGQGPAPARGSRVAYVSLGDKSSHQAERRN
jgi:hypothetical protein